MEATTNANGGEMETETIECSTCGVPHDFVDEHGALLACLMDRYDPKTKKPIERAEIDTADFIRSLDDADAFPDTNWRGGYSRVLNELVRWGYLTRLKAPSQARYPQPGYRPTAKAEAWFARTK